MASYQAVVRATFARMDREAAQARAYERKHGLKRRNQELRLAFLRQEYRYLLPRYLPQLDDPRPLARNHAGRELAKILAEGKRLRTVLGRQRTP